MIQIIYIGARYFNKKMYYSYKDAEDGSILDFSTKLKGFYVIGSILECERTESGVRGPYKNVGTHKDSDDITKWTAMNQAANDTNNANKKNTKELPNEYHDALVSLRFCYSKIPHSQRQVFINRVIMEMTR